MLAALTSVSGVMRCGQESAFVQEMMMELGRVPFHELVSSLHELDSLRSMNSSLPRPVQCCNTRCYCRDDVRYWDSCSRMRRAVRS